MLHVELFQFSIRHKLWTPRIIRTEEMQLAVMERATQCKQHPIRRTLLGLNRIARRPQQRLRRRLQRHLQRHKRMLRRIHQRRQNRPLEFALSLFPRQNCRVLTRALRRKNRPLRRARTPLLNRLRITHHLNVRTVLFLAHIRILRPNHLLHDRIELMHIRRPQQHTRKPALRHTIEIPLRRLTLNFLRVVVIPQMRIQNVRGDILFIQRGKSTRLALINLFAFNIRRHPQQHRRRIIQEEIRKVFQLVRMVIILQLANNRPQRLRLRQHFHLGIKRFGLLPIGLPAALSKAAPLPVKRLLHERLTLRTLPATPVTITRLALGKTRRFRRALAERYACILLRPIRREAKRTQCTQVDFRCLFLVHKPLLYHKFRSMCV